MIIDYDILADVDRHTIVSDLAPRVVFETRWLQRSGIGDEVLTLGNIRNNFIKNY